MSVFIPRTVTGLSDDVVFVDTGFAFTCALHRSGTVSCWGTNSRGQLGNGEGGCTEVPYGEPDCDQSAEPVTVTGITDAVALSTGQDHACAVLASGSLYCWGQNDQGQIGDGTTGGYRDVPVEVSGISGVTAVAGGVSSTCAITADGLYCWGDGRYGALGTGDEDDQPSPAPVELANVVDVAVGGGTACARRSDGSVWCWGQNNLYEAGNETGEHTAVPVQIVLP